jgi:hypothetical protein
MFSCVCVCVCVYNENAQLAPLTNTKKKKNLIALFDVSTFFFIVKKRNQF